MNVGSSGNSTSAMADKLDAIRSSRYATGTWSAEPAPRKSFPEQAP